MTILVAGGDSFIWGSELTDNSAIQYSKFTYPSLLAGDAGFEYSCAARPGNSNDAIARMIMLECEKQLNRGNEIVVLATWTFITRFEFAFTYAIDSPVVPWCSINPHGSGKADVQEFSDFFFKHVGLDDTYQQYNSLKAAVLLQTYLTQKNIPYMFTLADNNACSRYKNLNNKNLSVLRDLIDWNNWFYFAPATDIHQTTDPRGFYQWACENKYKCGPNQHPLEEAHHEAYLLMKEKFNELVKKSI